jgi:hypothetical protein
MQERNSIKFQVLRIRTEGTRDLEYGVSIMVNVGGMPSKIWQKVVHMGDDYIEGMEACLPQIIKSFQN